MINFLAPVLFPPISPNFVSMCLRVAVMTVTMVKVKMRKGNVKTATYI